MREGRFHSSEQAAPEDPEELVRGSPEGGVGTRGAVAIVQVAGGLPLNTNQAQRCLTSVIEQEVVLSA